MWVNQGKCLGDSSAAVARVIATGGLVLRLNADGAVDSSFGGNGVVGVEATTVESTSPGGAVARLTYLANGSRVLWRSPQHSPPTIWWL